MISNEEFYAQVLRGAVLIGSDLSGADLEDASFQGVDLSGVNLGTAQCPPLCRRYGCTC